MSVSTPSDDTLNSRQYAAIAALMEAKTIGEAAEKARVAESTLRRWLSSDRPFQTEYRKARRAAMDAVVGRLQAVAARATQALERNLDADRPSDVNQAARIILEHAHRGLEISDLMARVEEIEGLLKE
jgi:hypothetical protein